MRSRQLLFLLVSSAVIATFGAPPALADTEPLPGDQRLAGATTLEEGIANAAQAAEEQQFRWSDWGISLGASFFGNFRTEVRVDPQNVPVLGTRLRLEDDLGFDSEAFIYRIDAFYRFSRRHRVDFSFFDILRRSSAQTDEEITWGEYTIPATRIDLEFRTQVLKMSYRYNFVARKDWAMGIGLGIHWMRVKVGFELETKPTGGPGIEVSQAETIRAEVPLPLLGFHGVFAFSENWRLSFSSEFLRARIGPIDGFVQDTRLGLEWDVFDHVGLALNYNIFQLSVDIDGSDWRGSAEYTYQAAILSVRVFF